MGFSDKRLATLAVRSVGVAGGLGETQARRSGLLHDALRAMAGATSEDEVRELRHKLGVLPVFKRIDSCAAEFEAITPYMYSTYEAPSFGEPEDEAKPSDRRKIVILGGGPNRIGQGIEFDYCCVHACFALATKAGLRDDHGQLQPGNRLDRLRHLRPPLFRAADGRGRAGNPARRTVRTANWSA